MTAVAGAREIRLTGYVVTVAAGALARIGDLVTAAAPAHRYAVITDDNVGPLYGSTVVRALGSAADLFTIPAGEAHKTRATWEDLTDAMLAAGFGRDSTVVALGGGVVGDLAGFVAATYMRGIPVVQVPTSLLAMVDASVGGKVGVDTVVGKNLVGAFHPPAAVVIDPGVLRTLPPEHLRAGSSEIIKHGVIADECYFEEVAAALATLLQPGSAEDGRITEIIARSVEIKGAIVREDEREAGIRTTLNFGHTIGHAFELLTGYRLLHGEAVATGMVVEAALGERLAVTEPGTARRIGEVLESAGLPTRLPAGVNARAAVDATRSDKKARAGVVEYALPRRIGAMHRGTSGWTTPVADGDVLAALATVLPEDR